MVISLFLYTQLLLSRGRALPVRFFGAGHFPCIPRLCRKSHVWKPMISFRTLGRLPPRWSRGSSFCCNSLIAHLCLSSPFNRLLYGVAHTLHCTAASTSKSRPTSDTPLRQVHYCWSGLGQALSGLQKHSGSHGE